MDYKRTPTTKANTKYAFRCVAIRKHNETINEYTYITHSSHGWWAFWLPAATKLGQGNIFTGVCLSTGGRGVCLSACWDIPPGNRPPQTTHPPGADPPGADTPPEQTPPRSRHPPRPDPPRSRHPSPLGSRHPNPPREQTTAYGQRAAGTHPTGMHSCSSIELPLFTLP